MNELIEILGLKKEATQEDVINKVLAMKVELGKNGYASLPFIEKLRRDGYIRFSPEKLAWTMNMSDDEMRKLTTH